MGDRKGIDLLRYAVRLLDDCNETFNQRWSASQLIRIAEAMQKCEWDFFPHQWTERQKQECVQFGITPQWEVVNGQVVPKYHNESEKVFKVATTWYATKEVEVNADTLGEAIAWLKGDAPIPCDGEYLDDSFQVDEDCTREINQEDVG